MIDSFDGEYRYLSNFAILSTPVVLDGEKYISTEHAYQAAKFLDPVLRKQIRDCITPGKAKKLAGVFQEAGICRFPLNLYLLWKAIFNIKSIFK